MIQYLKESNVPKAFIERYKVWHKSTNATVFKLILDEICNQNCIE